jgi:hypothetical protein
VEHRGGTPGGESDGRVGGPAPHLTRMARARRALRSGDRRSSRFRWLVCVDLATPRSLTIRLNTRDSRVDPRSDPKAPPRRTKPSDAIGDAEPLAIKSGPSLRPATVSRPELQTRVTARDRSNPREDEAPVETGLMPPSQPITPCPIGLVIRARRKPRPRQDRILGPEPHRWACAERSHRSLTIIGTRDAWHRRAVNAMQCRSWS